MTNTKESTIKVVRDERGRFVKKAANHDFKVGDRVAHTYTKENDRGIIKTIIGDKALVKWEVAHQQLNWVENLYHLSLAPKPKSAPTPRPFKVGDVVKRLAHQCFSIKPGTIGTVVGDGETITVQWNGHSGSENYYCNHHKQLELVPNAPKQRKVEKRAQTIEVPEEIPAALQTLAKAFGYRVEKA